MYKLLKYIGKIALVALISTNPVYAAESITPATDTPPLPPIVLEPIDTAEILALNDTLKKQVDYYIKPIGRSYTKVQALVSLMFDKAKMGLEYKGEYTLTAIQTYETGGGNCVSLANLFVAMARYAGLNAQFVSITNAPNWEQGEDVYYVTRHTNAVVKSRGGPYGYEEITVDFRWFGPTSMRGKEVVSDIRAYAEYFSNLGVQAYEQGNLPQALVYLEHSTDLDSGYLYGWANLGVIYRKLQREQDAEFAYHKALHIDGSNPTALNNLAVLYSAQNRTKEAHKLLEKIEYYRRKNPYYLHRLAQQALADGRAEEAIRLLKKAIKKYDYEDKFYFTLARAYHQIGNDKLAVNSIEKALENVSNPADKSRYRRKLDFLKASYSS